MDNKNGLNFKPDFIITNITSKINAIRGSKLATELPGAQPDIQQGGGAKGKQFFSVWGKFVWEKS